MQTIPFTSDPAQSFSVSLDGNKYRFDARYNDRSGQWTLDITTEPMGVLLVAGVPILIGQDMLAPYVLGIGGLAATDTQTGGIDAGPDDLGDRVTVTWFSEAEMTLLRAAGLPG